MFVTLLLLFLNTGPLNAAMANVLPPDLRAIGFALYTVAIHLFGDFPSPTLIGVASDAIGLRLPVLVTGLLLVPAGLVLLLWPAHAGPRHAGPAGMTPAARRWIASPRWPTRLAEQAADLVRGFWGTELAVERKRATSR